jgi:hypothetical protein
MLEVARALSLSRHVFAGSSLEWSYNPYLTSIAPGGFVGLSRLQYLDLRNNALTGVVDWSGLTGLTYVLPVQAVEASFIIACTSSCFCIMMRSTLHATMQAHCSVLIKVILCMTHSVTWRA